MPTALKWGKGHNDEFVEFERGLNGASEQQLIDAARRLREPEADFLEVFWKVFFDETPDKVWDTARGNWFGLHPDPTKAGLPMWASNAVLTPLQVHALIKESTARMAEWLAGRGSRIEERQVQLWSRCAVPELQTWFLRPQLDGSCDPAVAHLFIATPYNAGYHHVDYRWGTPSPTGPDTGSDTTELMGALSALTALAQGDSVGDLLRAADRVASAAAALFGDTLPADDNEIFGTICGGLSGTGPGARPPFKATGLACRMSTAPAPLSNITVSTGQYTAPPDDHPDLRSELFDQRWTDRTYDGDHLRYRAAPSEGHY